MICVRSEVGTPDHEAGDSNWMKLEPNHPRRHFSCCFLSPSGGCVGNQVFHPVSYSKPGETFGRCQTAMMAYMILSYYFGRGAPHSPILFSYRSPSSVFSESDCSICRVLNLPCSVKTMMERMQCHIGSNPSVHSVPIQMSPTDRPVLAQICMLTFSLTTAVLRFVCVCVFSLLYRKQKNKN